MEILIIISRSLSFLIKILNFINYNIIKFKNYIIPGVYYELVSIQKSPRLKIITRSEASMGKIYLPKIYNLSDGGYINKFYNGNILFEIDNASFNILSDFIRFSDNTIICSKLSKVESEFARPCDNDYINKLENCYKLKKYENIITLNAVFNISGAMFYQWAHFLAQYYEKISFLKYLPDNIEIYIPLPLELDEHIRILIEIEVEKFSGLKIINVDKNSIIFAKKLYYVVLDTYVGDAGVIDTPFHIQVSASTIDFWKNNPGNKYAVRTVIKRKLYIARSGSRSIVNEKFIINYLIPKGYQIIYPHKLSLIEKIQIFSEAEFIVGALSSAFANLIFSQNLKKVLIMSNTARHLDNYINSYLEAMNIENIVLLGSDVEPGKANSCFSIDIEDLKNLV